MEKNLLYLHRIKTNKKMTKLSHFTGWNSKKDRIGNNVEVHKAALDGYHIGNMLEGVKFIIEIENGDLKVYVSDEDKNYLEEEWTKEQINKWYQNIIDDTLGGGLDFMQHDIRLGYDGAEELYLIDVNGKVV
jgi:hypothetical protein